MVVTPGFPMTDPVGPAVPGAPGLSTAVIAEVIAPAAATTDAVGVPRAHIDALAAAGLHGAPLEPRSAQREVAEQLAGCDASTWFCWTQHQTPMTTLAAADDTDLTPGASALKERLLPGMRDGSLLNAVAFAHVRRPGPPNPTATRVDGGWRLEGSLDWVTSWDIADHVMVMAQGTGVHANLLVCAYLPAGRSSVSPGVGLQVGDPLRLLAMSGTHTRPVRLDGLVVPDELVGAVQDKSTWLADDAQRTADPNPSSFGLARGAIAELHDLAVARGDDAVAELSVQLAEDCRSLRAEAYAAIDDIDRDGTRAERLRLRARSLDLAVRAASAVVVARAGASMLEGASAGRRVREALFLLVQAQTADTRAQSLRLLSER